MPKSTAATADEDSEEAMEVEGVVVESSKEEGEDGKEVVKKDSEPAKIEDLPAEKRAQQSTVEKLTQILSGSKSIFVHLQFLIRNDKSDLLILKQTKDAVRVSICHTATVIANGFMHSGTTHDSFLRYRLFLVTFFSFKSITKLRKYMGF